MKKLIKLISEVVCIDNSNYTANMIDLLLGVGSLFLGYIAWKISRHLGILEMRNQKAKIYNCINKIIGEIEKNSGEIFEYNERQGRLDRIGLDEDFRKEVDFLYANKIITEEEKKILIEISEQIKNIADVVKNEGIIKNKLEPLIGNYMDMYIRVNPNSRQMEYKDEVHLLKERLKKMVGGI